MWIGLVVKLIIFRIVTIPHCFWGFYKPIPPCPASPCKRQFDVFDVEHLKDLWYVQHIWLMWVIHSDTKPTRGDVVRPALYNQFILAPSTEQQMWYRPYLFVYGKDILMVSESMKALIKDFHVCFLSSIKYWNPTDQPTRLSQRHGWTIQTSVKHVRTHGPCILASDYLYQWPYIPYPQFFSFTEMYVPFHCIFPWLIRWQHF